MSLRIKKASPIAIGRINDFACQHFLRFIFLTSIDDFNCFYKASMLIRGAGYLCPPLAELPLRYPKKLHHKKPII
jgi:hypothetical protein